MSDVAEAAAEDEAPPPRWRALLDRTRPVHGPALLIAGVLWDFLTLRIDRLFDSLLLGLYLVLFAAVTVIELRVHLGTGAPRWLTERVHWAHNLGQFLLGGLLSAYLITYFRGAPLLRGLVWVVALAALALFNELAPRWPRLPVLWVPLLSVLGFHYVLAIGPVLSGQFIGVELPLVVAVLLGFGVHGCATMPWPGVEPEPRRVNQVLAGSSAGVGAVVLVLLLAWRGDWIPPLPLTLMGTEVVPERHEGHRVGVTDQLFAKLGFAPRLTWSPGARVEVRTPVYLPASMETTVLHIWEHHDGSAWARTDAIRLSIRGGRDEGFRTYSRKRNLQPGRWRVRVTTASERELGRVRFDLRAADPADAG